MYVEIDKKIAFINLKRFQKNDQVINEFIDELASTYEWVNSVSIGESYEGRDMRVIQVRGELQTHGNFSVTTPNCSQIAKAGPGAPNVWVEAGIHAREWISPAVATWLISELVENYAQHPQFVDNINLHFLPVANPDGYEYSRSDVRKRQIVWLCRKIAFIGFSVFRIVIGARQELQLVSNFV